MDVVEWPVRAAQHPPPRSERAAATARVVGVLGARGGVGASVLAAGVAQRLSRSTATALVSLDRASVGLDLLLGTERVPGGRWPDLAGARGEVPGAEVVDLLPRWGSCAVLGAAASVPGAGQPDEDVVRDVLRGLGSVLGAMVLDLGRGDVLAGRAVPCDVVVVVVPRDLAAVAGALALLERLPDVPVVLVVRGPAPGGMGVAEVGRALGLPVAATWPEDRRVAASIEHGGLRLAGRAARAVSAVVRALERPPGRLLGPAAS
ncbi:pilus assembly protein FlpE [Cellulomonas sp. PhB150]|uniref:pilus assembly protein FlpE n=1 Tax=Cellulomonas sp. PhB150 TaxID=2485188 RepID=UPI000FC333B4|nr:pilus assembly protein FlpE [Cellulomonas sp. PhB150]ROS31656.1 secretion/DNA translocation related CpaE-like protein [Cellulomonas sp. PhB150]